MKSNVTKILTWEIHKKQLCIYTQLFLMYVKKIYEEICITILNLKDNY